MQHNLTKSKYTSFRTCPKALWLEVFKNEVKIIDDNALDRFATGHEVGELAKGYLGSYEDMTVMNGDAPDCGAMIAKTEDALKRGVENICEAAFSIDGCYCAVDILHKSGNGYEIYEVKSSTSGDKEIYAWDVAFQKYVLQRRGLQVVGTYLLHIDNTYVRHGELEIDKLFKKHDIADAVDKELEGIQERIQEAKRILGKGEPDTPLSMSCRKPYDCAFWQYCSRELPKPSVFDLYRMDWVKRFELYLSGKVSFEDIRSMKLNRIQRMQVDGALKGEKHIDKDKIRTFLDNLAGPGKNLYPLYFLDFESIQPAIPLFDGTKPYQQIPTQYSLHIQDSVGAEPRHLDFLAPSRGNPMKAIAENLCKDIPKDAIVLVYNKTFECGRLQELADRFDTLKDHLLAIKNNIRDLLVPFQHGDYYLPAMGGNFSIKSVLPALFPDDPDLDYHALDETCRNGVDAKNIFPRLKDMSPEEENRTRQALLDYCKLDTLAMVKVLGKLYEAISS